MKQNCEQKEGDKPSIQDTEMGHIKHSFTPGNGNKLEIHSVLLPQ